MVLTRNNICYDLEKSPYKVIVDYDGIEVEYRFSSELYVNKFCEKFVDNRININKSLSNRFGIALKLNRLADLKLYITIEKRGFLIYQNGEKFDCLKDIILDGNQMIMQS